MKYKISLLYGFLCAMIAAPLPADVCREFRVALAFENSSSEYLHSLPLQSFERQAAVLAAYEATERVEDAAQAVRQSIDDKTAVAMIDGLNTAREMAARAIGDVSGWLHALPGPILGRPTFVLRSALDAHVAAKHAYRDSLKAVCKANEKRTP